MSTEKTWADIIKSFDPSPLQPSPVDMYNICTLVGLSDLTYDDDDDEFDKHLTKYHIPDANWICTDTQVGLAVYVLDGEVIAVSGQRYRKSKEDIAFVSMESAWKFRQFAYQFVAFDPPTFVPEETPAPSEYFDPD